MSVYKPKKSPYFQYDFECGGVRHSGSTGVTSRREAEGIERKLKAEAKAALKTEKAAGGPLTLGVACNRYFEEVGKHHAQAETTVTNLGRLTEFFGHHKPLSAITDDEVARLVSWRRGQKARGREKGAGIKPSTVNRSVIEPLQKLFNTARLTWKLPFPNEPTWKRHLLDEPQERVREVRAGEEAVIEDVVRADYLPLIEFARLSGLRLQNCLLRKDQVDLLNNSLHVTGKGGRLIDKGLTREMREILMSEMANETDFVFTYVARRTLRRGKPDERIAGRRYPITVSGLHTLWRRAKGRKGGKALPADLRIHDLRHDFATKLLRKTRNLKLVSKALNHTKIETTMRYAHVLDEEVMTGMEEMGAEHRARKGRRKNAT